MIEIKTRKRVRGGWGPILKKMVSIETVGQYLREQWFNDKAEPLTIKQTMRRAKIGDVVMVNFGGTLTEIASCYRAASDAIYQYYVRRETERWVDKA